MTDFDSSKSEPTTNAALNESPMARKLKAQLNSRVRFYTSFQVALTLIDLHSYKYFPFNRFNFADSLFH